MIRQGLVLLARRRGHDRGLAPARRPGRGGERRRRPCTASPMRRGPRTRIRSRPRRAASGASSAPPSTTRPPPPSSRARSRSSATSRCWAARSSTCAPTAPTDGGDIMPEIAAQQRAEAGARRLDLQRQRSQAAVRPRGERGQRRGDPRADPHGQPEPQASSACWSATRTSCAGTARRTCAIPTPPARPSSSARSATSSATSRCRSAPPSRGTSGCTIRSSRARSTISPSTSCPTGTRSRTRRRSTI